MSWASRPPPYTTTGRRGAPALFLFGSAPGSIEGAIYTTVPIDVLNIEVELQALALSVVLWFWALHPERNSIGWFMWVSFAVVVTLPTLGLLAKAGIIGG